jgi:hypothetical protein
VGVGEELFARGVETIAALPEPILPESGPGLDPLLVVAVGLGAVVLAGIGLLALRRAG